MNIFNRLKETILGAPRAPSGRCFVSHSYRDSAAVRKLANVVSGNAHLEVFPPIGVPPEKMVSNALLSTIRSCSSLVYIVSEASNSSPWVTLERDYALRCGLDVYVFHASDNSIVRDSGRPLDLPVFASCSRQDQTDVSRIVKVMADERYFDIFFVEKDLAAGENWAEAMLSAIEDRLNRGGYLALFWSMNSCRSEFVKAEFNRALSSHKDRKLYACRLSGMLMRLRRA